ncbi:phage tail protein [Escherichia coli]|uniref:phage tail-collar fiber domain-containing protein n=1 Tax=Escherichia coli TaxID=562 RepID=UPI0010B0098A|nr:phage tail protein [Escherichia coli]MCT6119304.1 phage tail protein [Escherichia coli]MCW7249456.1 phage tail protein [Escherichia coli]MDF1423122.1 phage tail protein [Escherichia coli]GCH23326.1 phage tail fiber protein [Escherichia coli]GCK21365.1 phage tail fiber protein [Escherichia coli]
MSALLTKAFEKWVAECTASNLPARPDAIIFALMEREPTREDNTVPEEKITYAVNELTYGQLSPNNIVCSAVVPDDCAFSYDWICLVHQASGTLCGVIKTPVRQKHAGESLIRNFTITYQGIARSAQITVPPQSWQVDIYPELKTMLKAPNHLSEIAAAGAEAQQESRDNLGLKSAATMESQDGTHDRTAGRLAIPGMFGFGKIFSSGDRIEFKTEADFLLWVKTATPGRYIVYGADKIIPEVLFSGTIEIIWPEHQTNPNPAYVAKVIIFCGINGHIYYNRYWTTGDGYLVGWENLKVNEATLRALIETRAPLNSPALTGTPSTPTPPDDAAGNEIANAAFVRKLLAALVDSSPEALDTLNELAEALGNDPSFATTMMNALAGKQPLSPVLTALGNLPSDGSGFPGFTGDGQCSLVPVSEKGKQLLSQSTAEEMCDVLGISGNSGNSASGGNYELQSDIYDRTPGRAAVAGSLGFGHIFTKGDVLSFSSKEVLLDWISNATPGRYTVSADCEIIPEVQFTGVIDLFFADEMRNNLTVPVMLKMAVFYGMNGELYRATYDAIHGPSLSEWGKINIDQNDITQILSRTTNDDYGDPYTGSITLAALQGRGSNKTVSIRRGQYYPGSALTPVVFSVAEGALSSPKIGLSGAEKHTLPGVYRALSGTPDYTGEGEFIIAAFIRTM